MLSKCVCVLSIILLLVISTSHPALAQTRDSEKEKSDGSTRLQDVVLEGQLQDLLTRFSLNYDVPLGLEISPDEQVSTRYRVELKEGTVADLMNQLVTQNPRYEWSIENGVVNLFPRDKHRDRFLMELLTVRIEKFAIKKNTDCWTLQKDLVEIPEVKDMMENYGMHPVGTNFTGFQIPQLGRNFSLGTSNTTLKTLLNRIVKDSPVARTWIVSADRSTRTVSLGVNSRQEVTAN